MRSMNNGNGQTETGPSTANNLPARFGWETAQARADAWTLWRAVEGDSLLTI